MSQVLTTCSACIQRPGFIRVLKGNREVWSPCICNANHQDTPCSTCSLCIARRVSASTDPDCVKRREAQSKEINAS